MKRHVGIYSGTFDPIHTGHISFALEALKVCNLDKIVFLPEAEPREKSGVTNIGERVQIIKKALAGEDNLEVLDLKSPQFTIKDTLPQLHEIFKDIDLTLLIGSDVVRTFLYRWQNLDILLKDVFLAIGMRSKDNPRDIIEIIEELEKKYSISIHYTLVSAPKSHVASSQFVAT